MNDSLLVMSWNVNGEIGISNDRMQRQLAFLDEHACDVDLYLFQAVNYEKTERGVWGGQLGEFLSYFEDRERRFDYAHTADWAHELHESDVQPHQAITSPHNRCNLTVCRWPIHRRPLSLRSDGNGYPRKLTYYSTYFPEKLLVAEIDLTVADGFGVNGFDVWNVGIINGANWHEEKVKMLETVYSRLYLLNKRADRAAVLGGDFNAPKREETDGTIVPHGGNVPAYSHYPFYGEPYYFGDSIETAEKFTFTDRWQTAEANVFDPAVGEWDMTDAYWAAQESAKHASTQDYTHIVHSGNPLKKRLDHLLVSDHFDVRRCEIQNGEETAVDGFDVSDHAPVVAELDLNPLH